MKTYHVLFALFLGFAFFGRFGASAHATNGVTQADHKIEHTVVNREENLRKFFAKYDSELANHVDTFVAVADEYGHDYRLLPAISCMESGCAKAYRVGTYNVFGWGIYGNNHINFASFDDAIQTVGKGIYDGYVVKGADTPEKMAPIYTPPNSRHWLSGVRFFMAEIES